MPEQPTTTAAQLSTSAWATPYSLSQRRRDGKPPRAEVVVAFPHGKGIRTVTAELDRGDLLKVIANAADALRLLDEAAHLHLHYGHHNECEDDRCACR